MVWCLDCVTMSRIMQPLADFLSRLEAMADATPCLVPRDDLLRLLTLAGLEDTDVFRVIAKGDASTLTTDRTGLLAAIEVARESE